MNANQGFMKPNELVAAARELSNDTDVAVFQWTMTIDTFRYLVDGTVADVVRGPLLTAQRGPAELDDRVAQDVDAVDLAPSHLRAIAGFHYLAGRPVRAVGRHCRLGHIGQVAGRREIPEG
jgi:hypothetical protein